MMERDEIVSQKTLVSDQKEEIHKEESEATVSQIGDETVSGLSKIELTDINGQRIEGKLLNIVKIETQKSFIDTKIQHTEGVLEENQVINGQLKCLLEAFEQEEELVVNTGEVSHVVKQEKILVHNYVMCLLVY